MDLLTNNLGFIGKGLMMTLALSLATLICATLVAAVMGLAAVARLRSLRWSVRSLTELFRGLPLIVNVFFVYFGMPIFGLELTPFVSIVISLTLWGGANGAEIVRGGLRAVPAHQLSSALALGMKPWEVLLLIQVPQAFRSILPAYVGMMTQIVQATTLGTLIGVTEFMRVGQNIVERVTVMDGRNPAFAVYAGVLLVYFVICSLLSAWGRRLERRSSRAQAPLAVEEEPAPAAVSPSMLKA
ncbi:amino acid ABC transporter permease [Herbaspirillum lusitanum]|uniref:Amino acid ABC transporter permease n=1 Tax=Herbaspirillum lusitanum TaxID=213312 RepID=A0ABW9AHR5_9BURK